MKILISLLFMVTFVLSQDGEISGVVHYNYSYDLKEDAKDSNGFGLSRAYFTYKKNISDELSYTFQTDVGQLKVVNMDEDEPIDTKTQFVAYLKKAYVGWKSPIGKLSIGLQGMNVFNITEKTWGFRFLEKSPMDLHNFSSSADMGIGYSGKINIINYHVTITNGTGYKKSEDDKYKKLATQFVYGEKKLVKNDGYNLGLVYTMESYDISENTTESTTVMSIFGGYASSCPIFASNSFRIGSEYDMMKDSGSDVTSQIMAFYGSYKLSDSIEGLLYYDMYDPDTNTEKDGFNYMILGVNYYATKGLVITPNIRTKTFEEGKATTYFKLNFQFKF